MTEVEKLLAEAVIAGWPRCTYRWNVGMNTAVCNGLAVAQSGIHRRCEMHLATLGPADRIDELRLAGAEAIGRLELLLATEKGT